ncbi:radical SAM protein [Pseudoduganella armeniaca]|uniref:Radical SAM protein n=1 Tax=Pseudoduganella armeniaca TaxID=2072590 RepID=A0A2R4C6W7_9BURK|nr:radical SAM protein [Pseudoduganella armeniaca]AVR95366.1 radical SAM protein [Pseudoduganella armeniaca]
MSRKSRPYLFYDTTTSVCSTCLHPVEAKILFKDDKVYMDKWCGAHGTERVLVSDDVEYYRLCREVFVKHPEMPQLFNTKMEYGCPYDCGLCPDHMQHSCLSVVEITDNCNLNCPVCYAESGTHRERHKPFEEVLRMLDAVVANEGEADVMQLSGGEPTLHPQFWDILDAAKARPIKHVMVNTNGIVLAQDKAFVQRLASYAPGIEVYLQFDSLRAEVHRELRGADLSRIRRQALDNLNEAGLSTTLVVTLKKGLNDDEIGTIIDFALTQPCVRGVTLQPIQDAGRVQDYDPRLHRLTVSEIRRKIAEQSDLFTLQDVVPVPCNPDTLAMAYAIKTPERTVPLTRWLDPQTLVEGSGNTIVFERDEALRGAVKDQVFKLFSTNHSPESQANCLSELMCCLPLVSAPDTLRYDNVFRVLIVQFMDAYSLDVRALKKSCIHFAQPDGKMVPFESYNLLYRDGRKLDTIRTSIAAQFAQRAIPTTRAAIPIHALPQD